MKDQIKKLVSKYGCKIDQYLTCRHPHGVAQISARIVYNGKELVFVRKYFSGNGDSVAKVIDNLNEHLKQFTNNEGI